MCKYTFTQYAPAAVAWGEKAFECELGRDIQMCAKGKGVATVTLTAARVHSGGRAVDLTVKYPAELKPWFGDPAALDVRCVAHAKRPRS
jgi:hypothetical protein